jgi:hypothetical protein
VPGANPVQQVVNDFVLEPVADGTSHSRRTHPPLLSKHPKRLGHGILRPAQRGGEITDADPRRPVQNEQNLEAVGVRQQIEALSPAGRVDIGQCRCRTLDLRLVPRLDHDSNLIEEATQ